ncbi:molybdate ABC transporter substrate-binding protein [Peribacillus alkalitolerans]|uniref:molybdate ABC transporter substrate-binding protein n=1 Tax=Peribacillus alkalitolerans TaxID=1550385 RepID=UPI0013D0E29B|nr:molybdate ABC transporter substrate-binding protein [Peribacillus alkalitolerans]
MGKYIFFIITLSLVLLLAACSEKKEEKIITVSAAASLTEPLQKVKEKFEESHPNVKVVFNFGSSGALKQQIIQGAPVDVFIAASRKHVDELVSKDLIQSSANLLKNDLVLIFGERVSLSELSHLKNMKSIAIGTPEVVPAGDYAKEALTNSGVWTDIQGKLVFAKDVKHVLTLVQSGNVDVGIVYKSDVQKHFPKSRVINIPSSLHSEIIYPVGIIKQSNEAEQFQEFLRENESQQIFLEYGFREVE